MNFTDLFKTEEEKQEFIDGCIQDMIEQELQNEKFIMEKQDNIMDLVYQHLLNKEDYIDNEDILYNTEKYEFSELNFCKLCSNMIDYANKAMISNIESSYFEEENCCLVFKGLNILIRTAQGQGTMYQMRTDLIHAWDGSKAFTYDEYKEFIKRDFEIK